MQWILDLTKSWPLTVGHVRDWRQRFRKVAGSQSAAYVIAKAIPTQVLEQQTPKRSTPVQELEVSRKQKRSW